MFSSKPPRENNDPHPNVWDGHSPYNQMRGDTDMFREGAPYNFERYSYRPRPEFDHIQHNEPNYLLVEAREFGADYEAWVSALSDPGFTAETAEAYGVSITHDHVTHAVRVLTRLANFKKEIQK